MRATVLKLKKNRDAVIGIRLRLAARGLFEAPLMPC
jgi:hypothetical protein